MDLEIKIRTLLEGQGIKVTDDQLKSLSRSAESAKGATSGAGRAAKDAGDSIQQFGRRGSEAKDAFEGLTTVARGGEGAIFGMAKAWRALTVAFAANPITAALALILGLLPLVKKGFDLIGEAAEKSAMKMAGTGEQVRAFQTKVEELKVAHATAAKKMEEEAKNIAEAWNKASSEIEGALRRFKEVESARLGAEQAKIELQRQTALGGATTQEQKDRINAEFDVRSGQAKVKSEQKVGDKELLGIAQKGIAADEQKRAAQKEIDNSTLKRVNAEIALDEAKRSGDPKTVGLAQRDVDAAKQLEKEATDKFQPQVNAAKSAGDDSTAAAKSFGFREQQTKAERATTSLKTSSDTASKTSAKLDPRIGELRKTAEAAQSRGDFGEQDRAVAELAKLRKANSSLTKAIIETGATTAEEIDTAKRTLERQNKQIKNSRSRTGS